MKILEYMACGVLGAIALAIMFYVVGDVVLTFSERLQDIPRLR